MAKSTLDQWNSASDLYNQNMGEEGDELNRDLIRPLIYKLLGDTVNKSLLDVGCGSGYLTSELATKASKVIGTDFSPEFIKICKSKYTKQTNLDFAVQDLTQIMEFKDGEFDIVLSKMVLQYVSEIGTFAKESKRILKSGGELLVIVDHPFHTQYYWAQAQAGKQNPKYPNLENYFSKNPQNKLSLWGKVELTWYPRTISDYIMEFINAGLELVTIEELAEEKHDIPLPRILALKFKNK